MSTRDTTSYSRPDPPDEPPRPGDRVKICGSHRFAGYTGKYVGDEQSYDGGSMKAIVKLDHNGERTLIWDKGKQLKKEVKK